MFGCSLKKCLVWGKRSDLGIRLVIRLDRFHDFNGAQRQGEEMTRTLYVVMAAILGIALLSSAMGCSDSGGNSNPKGSELFPSTPHPYDGQRGIAQEGPGLLDKLGEKAKEMGGAFGAGKFAGGWMFWPCLVCLVAGGVLLGLRIWGPGGILAAIGLALAVLQWGVGFGLKWYTALVALWIILWAVSLWTRFHWDDYIVYLGSATWLLLAALGQVAVGLPGLTWGLLQALLVFSVAPALWRQPTPVGARWFIMIPLWLLLLLTH